MISSMTVRYVGDENYSRRFLLQRQNGEFWTGRGWSAEMADARLYDRLSKAQQAFGAIQRQKYRGKREQRYKCQLSISVYGGQDFALDDLKRFLARSLHLTFDYPASGEGPNGSYVVASVLLPSLDAVAPFVAVGKQE